MLISVIARSEPSVARMERSEIRDPIRRVVIPDYAALHPGYGSASRLNTAVASSRVALSQLPPTTPDHPQISETTA
jgi:hypothetical protein